MDVLVTIPRGYDMGDKLAERLCYWRVRGIPRKTKRGERIYFIHDGEISMVADIVAVRDGSIEFEHLGYMEKPLEKYPSFRGFRYREARP